MSHYAPKVSDLVKKLVSPSLNKMEEELGQYLDIDHDDVSAPPGVWLVCNTC